MKCVECGQNKAILSDPRRPPMEEGDCLCNECHETIVIDELHDNINDAINSIGHDKIKDELANYY